MQPRQISSMLFCALCLFSSASALEAAQPRPTAAQWMSQHLHRPVEASQILVSPAASALEGCTITRVRRVLTGSTALSLRCPAHVLPILVMLNFPIALATPIPSPAAPPIVRPGAALRADWRTDSMHAELPVVALDSGAAGAEIRVRIAHTSRIVRARILSAHSVTIIQTGA